MLVLKHINTEKKMNYDPYLTSYIKTNSKWIRDLNGKTKTIKFLGENLCGLGVGKDFLGHKKAQTLKTIHWGLPWWHSV